MKIPENLLKVDDLTETYRIADKMATKTEQFAKIQDTRSQQEDDLYIEITNSTSKLMTVSILELVVIVLAGLYQFWSIRKFLVDKQYM